YSWACISPAITPVSPGARSEISNTNSSPKTSVGPGVNATSANASRYLLETRTSTVGSVVSDWFVTNTRSGCLTFRRWTRGYSTRNDTSSPAASASNLPIPNIPMTPRMGSTPTKTNPAIIGGWNWMRLSIFGGDGRSGGSSYVGLTPADSRGTTPSSVGLMGGL